MEKPEKCGMPFCPDLPTVIRCDLPKGHEGNHQFHGATFEVHWWNQEKNPQRPEIAKP